MRNVEKLEKYLKSDEFQKRLKLAQNFEKFSGGGILKKIKRLLFTPNIYIPYLMIVKFGLFKSGSVRTKLFWNREIKLPLKDYDSLALYKYGFAGGTESELKLAKYIIKNLEAKDVFYDIGANYGFFTYLATELCREVHSFEPNHDLVTILKSNTRDDSGVSINDIALSDTNGQAELHMSESTGLSTINASTIDTHTYTYRSTRTVQTQTLDTYIKTNSKPTFLKIDVEGAEEAVLNGSKQLLNQNAPIIAMEVWGKDNGWEISNQAVKLLISLGYEVFSLNSDGEVQEVIGDLSILIPPAGGDNFIFKKK